MRSSSPVVRPMMRKPFLVPLVMASGVLAALIVQRIVLAVVEVIGALATGTMGPVLQFLEPQTFWLDIVFALGVFLALWFVTPIAAGLRMLAVVIRSLLASAAGAVLVFIAIVIYGFSDAIGGLLGTQVGFQGEVASRALGSGIWTGGGYLVNSAPVVIIAGLMLWFWLGRHPSDTPVTEVPAQV